MQDKFTDEKKSIDLSLGNLNLSLDVDKNIFLQAKNGENSITCENDGEVYLFSNQVSANQQKLRTSNTGIYVTGIGTFTDKVSVIGSQNSMLTNNQLIFDRAGTSYIDNTNNSGSLSFRIGSSYTVGPQTYMPIFLSFIGINFCFSPPKLFDKKMSLFINSNF